MLLDDQSAKSDGEREALDFLRRARGMRGLSPVQFRRIEHALDHAMVPRRTRRWIPALAAVVLVLAAGSAAAHVMDLSRLPLIGPLFPAHRETPRPQRPHAVKESLREGPPPSVVSSPNAPSQSNALVPPPAVVVAPPTAVAENPLERRQATGSSASAARSRPSSRPNPRDADVRSADAAGGHGVAQVAEPAQAPAGPSMVARSATPDSQAGQAALVAPAPAARPRPASVPALAPSTPQTVSAEDVLLSESQSLSAAVADWHRDHNATAALGSLAAHLRRFPRGQMQIEANLLRAEILLHEGREREGLALLDGINLPGLPRGRELQTVRGELRIKYGRCLDGKHDLDRVLAKDVGDDLGRRAARAMALCR